ncbi:MAG: sigma 54-interacting transcriptional regulator [Thermodesulfobacteriota bacterium]
MITRHEDIGQYWKTILNTCQEGMLILSPSGLILSVNRAAEEITGYRSSELVGQPCTILECTGCKIFGRGLGPDWCELFVVGQVDSKRCLVTSKGRLKIHVAKRASVLRDEKGELIGAVETLTDISGVVRSEREIDRLRRSLAQEDGFHGLVGTSASLRRIFSLVEDAAGSDVAVMIFGESGTGKELVAQAIHKLSARSSKPLVKVDCVAFNANVLESELFGHTRGAFTGAEKTRIGRFEAADGGCVFLDEIGDVPPAVQVKLLRVLEEKIIERVGDNQPVHVDVRVISATNRDIAKLIAAGLFREDLFYRINVVPIEIPPLRERREDIPLLLRHFVSRLAAKTGKPITGFSSEVMAGLYDYDWPGNVRELKNVVEYAFVVCREGQIQPQHLPRTFTQASPAWTQAEPDERERLIKALRQAKGNQSQAARILGVSRMTVWKRMKKLGVNMTRDIF